MKLLVVGTGSIGRRHFINLWGLGFRDIAVVRSKRGMDTLQSEFIEQYSPRTFYDLDEALADQPLAVFICNPTSLHISTARLAIKAGAHVFLEKPISDNNKGIISLLREATIKQKIVYVGYHFRHHPLIQIAKKLLVSEKIGKIQDSHFVTGEYLPNWHPWEDYRKGYAARSDLGGGVTLTLSHDLDLIYWFFGMPKTVQAVILNSGNLSIDVDDVASITFTSKQCPIVTANLNYFSRPPVKQFIINGSKGSLSWGNYRNELKMVSSEGKIRLWTLPHSFEKNDMYISEIQDFLRCIKRKILPICNGVAGSEVLKMALAAKESSNKGRTIKL
jgi:predicted dehydrogenase